MNFDELLMIIEASKSDADKLNTIGEKINTTRKGANISNQLNDNNYKSLIEDITGEPFDYERMKGKLINKKQVDVDKFKNNKSQNRKNNVRSSTRNENNVVPNYGANPTVSSHADKKQIEKFKQSMRNKYDADKTSKQFRNTTAQRIVKDRIEKGKDLPERMRDKLIKQNTNKIKNEKDNSGNNFKHRFDKNDPSYNDLLNLLEVLKKEKDFSKYNKAFKRICNICSLPTVYAIASVKNQNIDGKKEIFFIFYKDRKEIKISEEDKLYHVSKVSGLTSLTPTFKSGDGVYYSSPRVYFSIGKPINNNGSANNSYDKTYVLKGKYKTYEDPELHGTACYIESSIPLPVEEFNPNK